MHHARRDKAYRIHEAEAEAKGAEFHNEGWGVNEDRTWISIASKTSKGVLTTNVKFYPISKKIDVTHVWED